MALTGMEFAWMISCSWVLGGFNNLQAKLLMNVMHLMVV